MISFRWAIAFAFLGFIFQVREVQGALLKSSVPDQLRASYDSYNFAVTTEASDASQRLAALNSAYKNFVDTHRDHDVSGSPSWSQEQIDVDGQAVSLNDLWGKFQSWVTGAALPDDSDLAFRFPTTGDNTAVFLPGNDKFWPSLMADLAAAKSSINIEIFGVTPDEWVWSFVKLLVQKAHEGVKVRILADKLGARMYWFEGTSSSSGPLGYILEEGKPPPKDPSAPKSSGPDSESLFQYLWNNGVEAVFVPMRPSPSLIRVDHRKYFIIDGKVAYNTGFTLQKEMHDYKYDEGMKLQGSIVHQMQLAFFSNFVRWGGRLPTGGDWNQFVGDFFPAAENTGTTPLTLQYNVPNVRYDITDTFYKAIDHAQKYIYLVSPYFASGVMNKSLIAAAKRGVDVRIIVPQDPVDGVYAADNGYIFDEFLKYNIKPYLFVGPLKYGLIHAKGMVVDGKIASVGSCNLDFFSLLYNDEQNITTEDPALAQDIEQQMFEYLFKYSVPYQRPATHKTFAELTLTGLSVDLVRSLFEDIE